MAFAYGADAVYAGQPRFSLLCVCANNEFDLDTLAIWNSKKRMPLGKSFMWSATLPPPHNAKLINFVSKTFAQLSNWGPDALIVSDPGVFFSLREHFPHMPFALVRASKYRQLGSG